LFYTRVALVRGGEGCLVVGGGEQVCRGAGDIRPLRQRDAAGGIETIAEGEGVAVQRLSIRIRDAAEGVSEEPD